jgi:hypothetical protein
VAIPLEPIAALFRFSCFLDDDSLIYAFFLLGRTGVHHHVMLIDRVLKLSTPASMPSAASNLDSPDVNSSVAGIIGMSHHTQIVWLYNFTYLFVNQLFYSEVWINTLFL